MRVQNSGSLLSLRLGSCITRAMESFVKNPVQLFDTTKDLIAAVHLRTVFYHLVQRNELENLVQYVK